VDNEVEPIADNGTCQLSTDVANPTNPMEATPGVIVDSTKSVLMARAVQSQPQ